MSIAIIVEKTNEDETEKFVTQWKHLIAQSKAIFATKTEKNKIQTALGNAAQLKLEGSTDLQGLPAITGKVNRGELQLVIYLAPNTNSEVLPRLGELISSAYKKHTVHLCFTLETAEIVLQHLNKTGVISKNPTDAPTPAASSAHVRESSQGVPRTNTVVQNLLRSVTTVADKSMLNKKVMNWSKQQLLYWLEANDLPELKPLFETDTPVPTDSQWDRHETLKNIIVLRSGKPDQLFEVLCSVKNAPLKDLFEYDDLVRDWYMTFNSFMSPKEFLSLLRKKFESAKDHGDDADEIIDVVENLLTMWIELEKGADFEESPELTKDFNDFMDVIAKEHPKKAEELKNALNEAVKLLKNPPEPDLKTAPAPIIPRKRGAPPNAPFGVADIDPIELARQITLMESNLLRKVRAKEFHGTAWTKKNAEVIAPNLTKVINISNHISNWMVTELLRLKTQEEMTELISKFIKVGKQLLTMNNFSGVMEVVTALNNSAINKLKLAWAQVPARVKETLDELMNVTSPLGHYKNYRAAFHARRPEEPALPILAASLSDLNGIEEVFATKMPDGSVNWRKMSKVANRIWETVSLNCIYPIKPVPEIITFIETAIVWRDALTTCAIADVRMAELNKLTDKANDNKKSKRRSTSNVNLVVEEPGEKRDELSSRDWAILLTGAQPKKYKSGGVIMKAGAANEHLYRINSGTVRVVKEIDGKEISVATMGENSMFGEVSMLLRSQKEGATASIVADSEVEIYALQIELVLQILESKPYLAEKLNRILAIKLARRLRDLNNTKKPAAKKSPSSSSLATSDESKRRSSEEKKQKLKESKDSQEEKEDKKEEKEATPEAKFQKKFKLESSEVIIKEYECSFKGNMTMHGSLFISPNYLCADFGVFGFKLREAMQFAAIQDMKKNKKKDLDIDFDGKTYSFTNFSDRDEAFSFLRSIWQHTRSAAGPPKSDLKKKRSTNSKRDLEAIVDTAGTAGGAGSSAAGATTAAGAPQERYNWLPSEEDWSFILKGARTATYKKDDVVINEGEQFRRVFQLARGECRFEKVIDGKTRVLGNMVVKKDEGKDNLFGEISFLEGGRASASVVCDKDDTQIYIIEGYFLDVLFEYYPDLPGRFYHYLAHVLSKRLKQRENAANHPAKDAAAPAAAGDSKKADKSTDKKKKSTRKTRESSSGGAPPRSDSSKSLSLSKSEPSNKVGESD